MLDGQEVTDQTNPLDGGSSLSVLGTEICAEWTGFLDGVWNISEFANMGDEPLEVLTNLYSLTGVLKSTTSFAIEARSQYDLLVHGLRGSAANTYGKICSNHSGAAGALDGRMVYYKPVTSGREAGTFQFAFAMPFNPGLPGEQILLFNTYQPSFALSDSRNLVANWIHVLNNSPGVGRGRLDFYAMNSALLGSFAVELAEGERRDYAAHHFGKDKVGFVRWTPADPQRFFQLRNVRYLYDNSRLTNSFATAFQLEALKPSGERLVMPFQTDPRQMSILELANTSEQTIEVEIELLHGQTWTGTVVLQPRETRHLILNSIIGDSTSGMVAVKSNRLNSLVSVVMQYKRFNDGKIAYMYGVAGKQALGDLVQGSFNRHLSQDNELVILHDQDEPQTVSISLVAENGEVLGVDPQIVELNGRGATRVVLNNTIPLNRYGVIRLQPERRNSVAAYVLRRRGNEYVMPTPLRQ